jgi:DNA invertase Pin-like site-specific DNA recombinase
VKAAGYTRISSDEQRRGNRSASIEEQRRLIAEHAEQQGLEMSVWFSDPGRSGGDAERPGLVELMGRLAEFDAVIIAAQDRLARHGLIWERFVADTDRLGVRRMSVREPYVGGFTATEREMEGSGSARASSRRWDDSANVRRGKNGHAAKGILPTGIPPIGYRSKGREFIDGAAVRLGWEVVPERADVVRRIYRDYLEGSGKGTIARKLEAEGVPSPSGRGSWSDTAVHSILTNGIYAGLVQWGKRRRPNPDSKTTVKADPDTWVVTEADTDFHPPMIDRHVWETTQDQIARRSKRGRAPGYRGVFTGRINCGHCGSTMAMKSWAKKDGTRTVIYRCDGHARFGEVRCPDGQKQIREDVLMGHVVMALNTYRRGDATPKVEVRPSDERRATLEKSLAELDDQIARAVELRVIDEMPIDEVQRMVKRLSTERDARQSQLEALTPDEQATWKALWDALADFAPLYSPEQIETVEGYRDTYRDPEAEASGLPSLADEYMVPPVDRDRWRGAVHRHIASIVVKNGAPNVTWAG